MLKKILCTISITFFTANLMAKELELLTYNTGLAHSFVALAKERLPHISKVLQTSGSDIICLQEVWKSRDRKKIIKALKQDYPYIYYKRRKQLRASHAPVCKIKDLFGEGRFLTCMLDNCMDGDSDQQTTCSRTTCGPALERLKSDNRECASTLMAQVGRSTLVSMYVLFEPFMRPGMFAYKGSNGLLLLSKYPLEDRHFIDWKEQSTLNHRGALVANVVVDDKKLQVACMHLTANLDNSVPYTGIYDSWEQENELQIDDLLYQVATKTPTTLMGDFNCSFANIDQGVYPDFEKNCQKVIANEYLSPVLNFNLPPSFSLTNSLVDRNEKDMAIDHIFVKGVELLDAQLVFQQRVLIKKKSGEEVESNISDHYGLKIKINY